jgi:hypothetical protein
VSATYQESKSPSSAVNGNGLPKSSSTTDSPSINDLRSKLQARIDMLRAKGKAKDDSPTPSPLPSGRESLLEERREKMRAEAEDAAKKVKGKKRKALANELETGKEEAQVAAVPEQEDVRQSKRSRDDDEPAEAKEHDLSFSNLSFSASTIKPVDAPRRRKVVNGKKMPSTAEAALERIQSRQKFLSKLTPQSRERAEEKAAWEGASKRAEGQKVLDDEGRLKKILKRKEKEKEKSRKQWFVDRVKLLFFSALHSDNCLQD